MNFSIGPSRDACFWTTQPQLQVIRYKLKMARGQETVAVHSQGCFRPSSLSESITREPFLQKKQQKPYRYMFT